MQSDRFFNKWFFRWSSFIKNIAIQILGYEAGVLTNSRPLEDSKFLPPVFTSAQETFEFFNQVNGQDKIDRIATIVFTLSGTGYLAHTKRWCS